MLEKRATPFQTGACMVIATSLYIAYQSVKLPTFSRLLAGALAIIFAILAVFFFVDYIHDIRRRNWIAISLANAGDPVARFAEAIKAMDSDQRALLFSLLTSLASSNIDTSDLVQLPLTGERVPIQELVHYATDIDGDNAPAERSYQIGPARNAYRNIANELEQAGLVQQQSGNQRSKIVDREGLRRYMLDILK